ncbi:MAG: parallel beta-helix domain-containing protein [Planctomycetota bacterium]|jgi:parallel beta-helix repeat protein|nr:parallel beta-helix domain-containing protein [Planctomycetota bacterium]MDP6990523.1 parallel beta-helix domain-containing protein [Planctomycetota bacterium]
MLIRPRTALSALLCCIGAGFLLFVYAPIPGLVQPGGVRAGVEGIEAAALARFEAIAAGTDLDRSFPPMVVRQDNPSTPQKEALGKLLYFDPLLSGDDSTSCAHCHHPDLGFSDNRALAMGRGGTGVGPQREGGKVLRRGSPTIWNAVYNARQFWDGRAADLEEQAAGPIQDAGEMDQDPDALVAELAAIPEYVELFTDAFGGGAEQAVTFEHVTDAIAVFERTIVTASSPYDRYAAGDRDALTEAERRGLAAFRSLKTRCFECHNVPTFANPDFKVVGVPPHPDLSEEDLGRGEVAGAGYEHAFKVPTLRNIALTAPYMHNGVFETLEEVLDFYADGGGHAFELGDIDIDDKIRPFELSERERADLIAFLHALTDESSLPEVPSRVPSGLPVVERLPNRSPELARYRAQGAPPPLPEVERDDLGIVVRPGHRIQDAIDAAQSGERIRVMPGEYHESLAIDVSDLTIEGVTVDGARPVLDGRHVLSDAVTGSGSRLTIEGIDVRDYTANGLMINLGTDITFRDIRCSDSGLYGLYPVEAVGVLIEDCTVTGVRDAGIYVGQSKDIVVRNNDVHGNVTGIEIENSVGALVEGNHVHNNAGGVLVFLLPNNPSKVSTDCVVRGNTIVGNNHENFASPEAVVANVPSGTGVMLLAADRVEVTGNTIRGNDTVGIAVVGLDALYGSDRERAYDVDPIPDGNWIHDNEFAGNGGAPDPKALEAGLEGADVVWDLSGYTNSFDEQGVRTLPPVLPASEWSDLRRRANHRLWQVLAGGL